MTTKLIAAAFAACLVFAAPAMAEEEACIFSTLSGKVSNLVADCKAFFGFESAEAAAEGEAAEGGCQFKNIGDRLNDAATKARMTASVLSSTVRQEAKALLQSEPASCCATGAATAASHQTPASDPRLDALAKVFGPAVLKNTAASSEQAACATNAEDCPLELAATLAAKTEGSGSKSEAVTADLPACCAAKLEAATD